MARVTVVVPCFDEERRLAPRAYLDHLGREPDQRLLFVDDGSRDGTLRVLEGMRAARPASVSVLALPRNVGKGEAVRRGVLSALDEGCDAVGYWDADLAAPLEAIADLARELAQRPALLAVLGSRVALLGRSIRRSALRHAMGRVFASAAAWTLRLAVYDTQCGAKLFRAVPEVRAAFAEPFGSRWVFDVELLARLGAAHRAGRVPALEDCVREQPLEHWHDPGQSKVRARDFLLALRDLARIRRRYRP